MKFRLTDTNRYRCYLCGYSNARPRNWRNVMQYCPSDFCYASGVNHPTMEPIMQLVSPEERFRAIPGKMVIM